LAQTVEKSVAEFVAEGRCHCRSTFVAAKGMDGDITAEVRAKVVVFMRWWRVRALRPSVGRSHASILSQARSALGAFIETVYNCQRLHPALDYRSPDEYEATLRGFPEVTSPPEVSMAQSRY
jgi:hypothetical protein